MLFKFVLLAVITAEAVGGVQLNCDFIDGNKYSCQTTSIFRENSEITSIVGKHTSGNSNKNVELFTVPSGSESNFMPQKICRKFSNMKEIEIKGRKIEKISREVFESCNAVNYVEISSTQLFWLPENAFEFLPNLERLTLSSNRLKFLPMNLFQHNPILVTFSAKNNQIEIIEVTFGGSLNAVNLIGNECIDDFVIGKVKFNELNKKVFESCSSSKQKVLLEQIDNSSKTIVDGFIETTNNFDKGQNFKKLEEENRKLTSIVADLQKNFETTANSSNYFKNITVAQKSFIDELLVNITRLRKESEGNKEIRENFAVISDDESTGSSTIENLFVSNGSTEANQTDENSSDSISQIPNETSTPPSTESSSEIPPEYSSEHTDDSTTELPLSTADANILKSHDESKESKSSAAAESAQTSVKDQLSNDVAHCKPVECQNDFFLTLLICCIAILVVVLIVFLLVHFYSRTMNKGSYHLQTDQYFLDDDYKVMK
jgi:hypothetical protein